MSEAQGSWTRPPLAASLLDRATQDQEAIQAAMRWVPLADGSSRRVLDCGDGDAVLLMPMVTELNFVYAPQLAEFQTDHRMVLYEPLLSSERRVGISDRADEARDLLSALGIDKAHIIVWGDTGSAAYQLAKNHPAVCRSIVFIGLADRYRFRQPYGLLLAALRNFPLQRWVPSLIFAVLLGRFVGGSQIKPRWIVKKAIRVPRLTALFKLSILPNLTEHRPVYGEVRTPAQVIVGDNDRIVSADQAKRMSALLPGAVDEVILPGGEHFISYVESDDVNRIIRGFLLTVP